MVIEEALNRITNGRALLTRLLNGREGVGDLVRRGVSDVLKLINVPTRSDLSQVEKKLLRVEKNLDKVARQILKKRARQ